MKRSFSRQLSVPHRFLNSAVVIPAIFSVFYVAPVFAQDSKGGFAIEEVVVTARKREESMQEVPVAVSAFSAEGLKSLGITNVKDMEGIVPGLNMGGGGNGAKGDASPYIRGIGQRETKVTVDSAVATYLDGIYLSRSAGSTLDALDVQSMQVLRAHRVLYLAKILPAAPL
ncbi:TonB-dependent receptor plug domain-containing protein [Oceanicoccus sp. KOV_DT_Chl]|uniref:TonB-dependent receptor plug domain-containing protein n=1 Tax=Oceanicoccus sp. KOV_DT_Chl TaxID=1904639 RepID=UPI000C7C141A|nr:TonB-dependent receptor plug domain-containing protein [Oceanicoccus sp. KOV_DT_Chl]